MPEGLLRAATDEQAVLPRRFKLPADSEDVRHYDWEHRVMRAEVNTAGQAQLQSLYRWLEQSVFEASAGAGFLLLFLPAHLHRWLGHWRRP